MNLPDLALQIVYGRLAWALVAAALLLSLLSLVFNQDLSRRTVAATVAALVALMLLPGEASPAYWLALGFQYPSGLLVGCSVVALYGRWQRRPVRFMLHPGLALPLAAIGLVLYLDAFGVLALGLYYGGFGARAAPLLACAAAAACALAIMRGQAVGTAAALLTGVLLFSLLRLPSGNLWDALLDPLLWAWAVVSVAFAAVRQAAARRTRPLLPQAAPASAPVSAAAIEQLQTVRE